jgi:hypothetical protein
VQTGGVCRQQNAVEFDGIGQATAAHGHGIIRDDWRDLPALLRRDTVIHRLILLVFGNPTYSPPHNGMTL